MDRYLKDPLAEEIDKKILLLTGPRQCGKTTLSKVLTRDFQYINHDLAEHRLLLAEKSWDREKALIIFDELNKMHEWKSWLKGIYDVEGIPPGLMVTGSARPDAFRKVGDSLAGRHFQFRLHPSK
jgi:predicted AAA+ superfamily ATPase